MSEVLIQTWNIYLWKLAEMLGLFSNIQSAPNALDHGILIIQFKIRKYL